MVACMQETEAEGSLPLVLSLPPCPLGLEVLAASAESLALETCRFGPTVGASQESQSLA